MSPRGAAYRRVAPVVLAGFSLALLVLPAGADSVPSGSCAGRTTGVQSTASTASATSATGAGLTYGTEASSAEIATPDASSRSLGIGPLTSARGATERPFGGVGGLRVPWSGAREALFAGLVTDPPPPPPAPPTLAGTSTENDGEGPDSDRPVYRRGWFYMVAAGLAAVAIAWIRHDGDGHDSDDEVSPKQDPGFPPPPGTVTAGWSRGERSNR